MQRFEVDGAERQATASYALERSGSFGSRTLPFPEGATLRRWQDEPGRHDVCSAAAILAYNAEARIQRLV